MQDPRVPELPVNVKRLIAWVIGLASLAMISAATEIRDFKAVNFGIWAIAAAAAGAVKIPFKKIHGCYSLGYMVVLAAVALLSFPETVGIAVIAAVAQCYWRPRKRPSRLQVAFNASNYAISAAAAWYVRTMFSASFPGEHLGTIGLAALMFFAMNSGLVAMILAGLSSQGVAEVWSRAFVPVMPLYLAGFLPAAIIYTGGLALTASLAVSLACVPGVYLAMQWCLKQAA